jgi:hypothetical protein
MTDRARRPRGRPRPVWMLPPALLLAGLLGAACASSTPTSSVASLPGHGTTTTTPAGSTSGQFDNDFVDFTQCMRRHGVQMADPFHRPGHQGLSIELPPRTASSAPAYHACNHYIAAVVQTKEAHQQQVAASQLQALTNYAVCMRAHDIPMLDPGPDGQLNLGNVPGITADFGRYSPQFRSADRACRHLLPAGVRDDGTGP